MVFKNRTTFYIGECFTLNLHVSGTFVSGPGGLLLCSTYNNNITLLYLLLTLETVFEFKIYTQGCWHPNSQTISHITLLCVQNLYNLHINVNFS